jgi:hypothetical protein
MPLAAQRIHTEALTQPGGLNRQKYKPVPAHFKEEEKQRLRPTENI